MRTEPLKPIFRISWLRRTPERPKLFKALPKGILKGIELRRSWRSAEASRRAFPHDAAHSVSTMSGFSGDLADGVALCGAKNHGMRPARVSASQNSLIAYRRTFAQINA